MRSLDRDVYQIVRKLEEGESRRLTIASVFESIKRSNSSLARQKRRPLEESIERVLEARRVQQRVDEDSVDSEAAVEAAEKEREQARKSAGNSHERDAFLLNRQIAKSWNFAAKASAHGGGGGTTGGHGGDGGGGARTSAVSKVVEPASGGEAASSATPRGDRQANGEPKPKRRKVKEVDRSPPQGMNLDVIAGLDGVMGQLLNAVRSPLVKGHMCVQLNTRSCNRILLHGPSGCGKTMLAHAVAGEIGVAFIPVSAQSLIGGVSGESEQKIRDVFDEALQLAPALVFIDEIDCIAGRGENAQKGMDSRMVAEIADSMDRIMRTAPLGKNVVFLAATNTPEALHPVVRRRFNIEVELGMPDEAAREDILRAMTQGMPLADDVDFKALARATPGYVGSDLQNAVLAAVARVMDEQQNRVVSDLLSRDPGAHASAMPNKRKWLLLRNEGRDSVPEEDKDVRITSQHFAAAIKQVQPASRREGFSTIPDTTWAHVGAMDQVREQLEMSIIGPIQHPERYAAVGIKPAAGILLWGPPGCGKTLVAKAVANESKANFISIKGPELLNKYVGESERSVRQLFARARSSAPCVLFFDEMDALVPRRDDSLSDASARVVNTLLTELDGVGDRSGIYVVGATNRPDMIDEAIRRPGRLGTSIFVGLPSPEDRVDILETLCRNAVGREKGGAPLRGVDLRRVALDPRCAGFSGADLGSLMQAAAQACLKRCNSSDGDAVILAEDWEYALGKVRASVRNVERYDHLME
ncbi:hypothetical protein P8C59_005188 [Phyllachora maydis]|uniref:Peroxisomal ATPase PEX1 n=1 Tax=Phyllachora maydis TaxID=1825666 RepID=A0AAD9ME81_9PEZI|nr:hypothetical protein P8C59_005188 [Phyllachora maydis]